jgi:hypothetical protein
MAAAAELIPASPLAESAAETDVRGVFAPVEAVDPFPERDALAAYNNGINGARLSKGVLLSVAPREGNTLSANL